MALTADFGLQASRKKRAAAGQRDASLAQNAYSRFLSQQRGARDTLNVDKTQTAGLEGFGASYGERGLRNSGIYQQAQSNYGQQWMQQRQDINDQIAQSLRNADFGDSQAWNQYETTAADADAQKTADILAAAAALDQFRPFLGG